MILDGKVGVITGAAQGIGRAYALEVDKHGAKVAVADIADASATAKLIEDAGAEALSVTVDVSDEASVERMAEQVLDKFKVVDFLVNNAAIYGSLTLKYWADLSVEEWDGLMAVNVRGPWLVSKAFAPSMSARHKGKIINISSATAHLGMAGSMHYITSKAGIIGMTRAMARELGDFGINVNVITPGFTMSDASLRIMDKSGMPSLVDMVVANQCFKRSEQPEDLVGTVVFLASDLSDFITGQVINVDGGLVAY
jgi:NAD(P)-dependent dehydrogenase (short-subunit alcohol dehydrogenase family)